MLTYIRSKIIGSIVLFEYKKIRLADRTRSLARQIYIDVGI